MGRGARSALSDVICCVLSQAKMMINVEVGPQINRKTIKE